MTNRTGMFKRCESMAIFSHRRVIPIESQINFGHSFPAALTSRAGKTPVCGINRLASHVQTKTAPKQCSSTVRSLTKTKVIS